MDLDGLKQINDRHGHLAGSRAICRLGNVLRVNSRIMDTAARYGGDEFALVLPEADPQAAERVGRRICERLASDGEAPGDHGQHGCGRISTAMARPRRSAYLAQPIARSIRDEAARDSGRCCRWRELRRAYESCADRNRAEICVLARRKKNFDG